MVNKRTCLYTLRCNPEIATTATQFCLSSFYFIYFFFFTFLTPWSLVFVFCAVPVWNMRLLLLLFEIFRHTGLVVRKKITAFWVGRGNVIEENTSQVVNVVARVVENLSVRSKHHCKRIINALFWSSTLLSSPTAQIVGTLFSYTTRRRPLCHDALRDCQHRDS